MVVAFTLTNGVVLGFEWSLKHKLVQFHLSFFSIVFMWGFDEEELMDDTGQ